MLRRALLVGRQLGSTISSEVFAVPLGCRAYEQPASSAAAEAPSSSRTTGHDFQETRSRMSPVLRNLRISGLPDVQAAIPEPVMRDPTPDSLRTALIAVKVGMVSEWDEHGVLTPMTVLWFDDNQVTQVKVPPFDVTTSLQVGCGSKKAKRLPAVRQGFFLKNNLPFKSKLAEFRVSPDALLPVGTQLNAAHFVAGQYVDVTGVTKGKGFQGVIKRWGMKGQVRTHGHSLSHRSIGSIGMQGYSRVLPGRHMAGRMGGKRRLQLNCWVYRVDPQRNLLWIKGSLQGPAGAFVYVRDSRRKALEQYPNLPFPTWLGDLPEPTQAKPVVNKYDAYKN